MLQLSKVNYTCKRLHALDNYGVYKKKIDEAVQQFQSDCTSLVFYLYVNVNEMNFIFVFKVS